MSADTQRTWFLADGKAISFASPDASIRESHVSELTVTDNPVETGVVVSDHAYMQPDRYEMDGRISDAALHGAIAADPFASSSSRSEAAWQYLVDLQKAATPFSIQTGLKFYPNMIITVLTGIQDKDTSNVLDFHATLRTIEIVNTQNVTFPPRKPKKSTRVASPKVDGGEKSADPVTAPKPASLLLKSAWGLGIVSDDQTNQAGSVFAAAQGAQ